MVKKKLPKLFEFLILLNLILLFCKSANLVPLSTYTQFLSGSFSYSKNNADVFISEQTPDVAFIAFADKMYSGTIKLYGNDSWIKFVIVFSDLESYANLKIAYYYKMDLGEYGLYSNVSIFVKIINEYPDPDVGNITIYNESGYTVGSYESELKTFEVATAKRIIFEIYIDAIELKRAVYSIYDYAMYQVKIVSSVSRSLPKDVSESLSGIGEKYNSWMVVVILTLVLGMYISAVIDKPILALIFFIISLMLFISLVISLGFDLWNWAGENPVSQVLWGIADFCYDVEIAGWKPLKPLGDLFQFIGDAFRLIMFVVFFFLAFLSYSIVFIGFSLVIYKVVLVKMSEKVSP